MWGGKDELISGPRAGVGLSEAQLAQARKDEKKKMLMSTRARY